MVNIQFETTRSNWLNIISLSLSQSFHHSFAVVNFTQYISRIYIYLYIQQTEKLKEKKEKKLQATTGNLYFIKLETIVCFMAMRIGDYLLNTNEKLYPIAKLLNWKICFIYINIHTVCCVFIYVTLNIFSWEYHSFHSNSASSASAGDFNAKWLSWFIHKYECILDFLLRIIRRFLYRNFFLNEALNSK